MSFIASGRSFIFRENFPLTIDEIQLATRSPTIFHDQNVTVHAFNVSLGNQGRKRSLDELQIDKYKAGLAEDFKSLQHVLSSMFNTNPGSLNVSGDDVDYLVSLEHRLKEDAERLRLMKENDPDEEMEPSYVDLCPPESPTKKSKGNGGKTIPVSDSRPLRRPWPASTVHNLPVTTPSQESMSYIVSMPPRRGKFDAKKARALGVNPGPDFARLVAG